MSNKINSFIYLMVFVFFALLFVNPRRKPVVEFKPDIQFEYGEEIKELTKWIDEDNSRYDFMQINEALKEDEVGEFIGKIEASYKNKTKLFEFTYSIIDTQPPILEGVKDIEITQGDVFALDALEIKAHDLVDGELSLLFEGEFDVEEVGTYPIDVVAMDKHGNKTSETFSLNVIKKNVVPKQPISSNATNESNKYVPMIVNGHVIVNKVFGIPSDYALGENETAVSYLRQLIQEMKSLGMSVDGSWAGYRTYDHQEYLYTNYVRNHGQAMADISSAKPGHSEHQTGLAFDLRSPSGVLLKTEPEISWVKDNAHLYGFVIRYPDGKTDITGYKHEPWHLRYMGNDAQAIYESGLTLEEYFNVPG